MAESIVRLENHLRVFSDGCRRRVAVVSVCRTDCNRSARKRDAPRIPGNFRGEILLFSGFANDLKVAENFNPGQKHVARKRIASGCLELIGNEPRRIRDRIGSSLRIAKRNRLSARRRSRTRSRKADLTGPSH